MGLTIHYRLQSDEADADAARAVVSRLRSRALDLPFAGVGDLIELRGDDCDFEQADHRAPHRWLLIQAASHVECGNWHFNVAPKHVVAFTTSPGDGCEDANFGLCRYPASIMVDDPQHPGARRRLACPGPKWRWSSFCKTQYASDPNCGGVQNFLRCHLSVVALLDHAKSLGVLGEVHDEGDYWERRDPKRLAIEVGDWNEQIAGFVGRIKDAFGDPAVAPITQFPDFEHLEARGRKNER